MAFTQADLDAIDEAIATGALSVEYSDKKVTFDSFEKLQQRRDYIAKILAGQKPGIKVVNTYFDKGLNDEC